MVFLIKESASMSPKEQFEQDCRQEIAAQGKDAVAADISRKWMDAVGVHKYSYHFSWLGRPIIQYPQDIVAMQELIASVQPDLVIETGIAHGGSLVLYASLLELNAVCGGPANAMVLGIDIDIREHNRKAIESHPMAKRIDMIQGSSIAPETVRQVTEYASAYSRILVCLDSNHTHEHVLAELNAYSGLVSKNSYCVVFDTVIGDMPENSFPNRPWDRGNNPETTVAEFLGSHPEFTVDSTIDAKLLISVAPGGYLRRN